MVQVIKNILVPLNFSGSSERAVQIAVAMCKRHDAALHLLKVDRESDFPYPSGKNALLIGIRLESRVSELRNMEMLAKHIQEIHQINCFYHIERGTFSNTVAEIAENFYCDLIVAEKNSRSALFNFFFNRDVCKLIDAARPAVMIVPPGCFHQSFRAILMEASANNPEEKDPNVTLPIIEKNDSKILYESGTAKSMLRNAIDRKVDLIVISARNNPSIPAFIKSSYNRFIINHSVVPVLSV